MLGIYRLFRNDTTKKSWNTDSVWKKSQDRQFCPLTTFFYTVVWCRLLNKREKAIENRKLQLHVCGQSALSISLKHTHTDKKHTYTATCPPHAGVITLLFLNKLKLLLKWMKIENQFFNQFSLQFVTQPTPASERSDEEKKACRDREPTKGLHHQDNRC